MKKIRIIIAIILIIISLSGLFIIAFGLPTVIGVLKALGILVIIGLVLSVLGLGLIWLSFRANPFFDNHTKYY